MSSVVVNDENQGVCPVRKHIAPETSADIFALDQPTGRPSILRQSQAENLNKNVPKGVKVCFQTPRRDPVTKKIMSPSRVGKMASLDDCTALLESLSLTSTETPALQHAPTAPADVPSTTEAPYPDDEMPIQSKGGYTIDFDNLELMNPFQGSAKMILSPCKPALSENMVPPVPEQPDEVSIASSAFEEVEKVEEKQALIDMALDETVLLNQSVENALADISSDIPSTDTTVIIGQRCLETPVLDQSSNDVEDLKVPEPVFVIESVPVGEEPSEAEKSPLPPKVAYSFDFDNLDSVNPFQTGGSKLQNSPPLGRKAPVSNSPPSEMVEPKKELSEAVLENTEAVPENIKAVPEMPPQPEVKPAVIESTPASELPPKAGSLLLEFNVDNVSEMPSQPEVKPEVITESTLTSELPPKASAVLLEFNVGNVSEMPPQPELKPVAPVPSAVTTESTTPSELPPKDNKMLLEFNFDDGAEVKRKPPPKRLGMKRPPGAKPAPKKTSSVPDEKKSPEPKPQFLDTTVEIAPVDIPVAKGSYNFDFDKFDDPNFNPFGAKASMANSPPRGDQSIPVMKEEAQAAPLQTTIQLQSDNQQGEKHDVSKSSPCNSVEESADVELSLTKTQTNIETELPIVPQSKEPCIPVTPEPVVRKQTPEPCPLKQSAEFGSAAAEEEFVPGSMFLPNDFDEQIDYLEQFGSSTFKESALRKQSLYLKFDPLVKESPKKTASADSTNSGFCLPRPSLAIRMMEAAKSEVKQKSQQESPKLLEDFPPLVVEAPVVQDPTVLDLLVPTLKQPQKSEGVIVDVLKYSQKDMDAAMERARKQAEEKEEELKAQIAKMTMDNEHMVLIVSEFETIIAQITAEHKQKEELVQAELSKVFQEKQQLAKDLNDMERSFSDVVKRLDRRKEVIDGFKKNEETLKQCAQSYLARLQKEEQRYQMLKTHAEEKIEQANKEIADVRSKLGTEISALQVQLRREQLKVQSLEKNLEQKVKEVEDVTKLCDELIMKVQKH
ncbi:transforming acidic coiled-coil-containing protein 3 [Astyanax mexicanus]|uniref:Transforming acidic coiled-coil-containing protein 3 n=1 Tax=Astyanax mexicanus TaxID=7994 RepID=A0A8B9RBX1_ASTMX|nr:transforming acidic coiled-coil-containing protein 3 [Astyanax mexicanus]